MNASMKRLVAVGLSVVALAAPGGASAGTAEEEARKSFEEGLALEATQPAEACKSFRRSLEFTRELGPLTKVKECDAREGRLLEAREKLRELTTRLQADDPELPALKAELVQIEGRIAHIDVAVRAHLASKPRVTLDAKPLTVPARVEVDPGTHEIVVETEGRPVERTTLSLGEGEAKLLQVPSENALQPRPGPAPAPASEGLSGLGIAGLAIGSVGVAGLIGGAITGGVVLSSKSEFDQCRDSGTPSGCDARALSESGGTLLTVNGALFIGGGALAAVGATLLIVDLTSGPSNEQPVRSAFRVGPGSAAFELGF